MQSVKRKRRCEVECTDHIFSLQSLKNNSTKYDVRLLFCPKFQRQPLPPEQTFPEFNKDSKYYTPPFILGVDRKTIAKNDQEELMNHQKHARQSLEKHNQLAILPRPNQKHTLCSVCKEHYKNYYYHIVSKEHKQKISQSLHNTHIQNLCKLYQHLWEGAEQRADEQALKRDEQKEKRLQQIAEAPIHEDQDEESSLIDLQKVDNDLKEDSSDDYFEINNERKKRLNKNVFKEDETIPFTAKPTKRKAPEGRTYTSEYLRKKFIFTTSPNRGIRQRQQRRYQRERDKLKTQRDNPQINVQPTKIKQRQGDVFIIMKAVCRVSSTIVPQDVIPTINQDTPKVQIQPKFVWKKTTDKLIKRLQSQTAEDKEKYELKERREEKQINKCNMKDYGYIYYPPLVSPYMLPSSQYFKDADNQKGENFKKNKQNQKYKEIPPYFPPYYYNPYMFYPMPQPYPRTQTGADFNDKPQKNSFHFNCPYNRSYMPPVSINSQNQQSNLDQQFKENASININFPTSMPAPSMSQYPQYQYHGHLSHQPDVQSKRLPSQCFKYPSSVSQQQIFEYQYEQPRQDLPFRLKYCSK